MSHLEAVRSYYEAWMAGQLVRGELIYDAQELRAAMAAGA